jgi:hypothetical protein
VSSSFFPLPPHSSQKSSMASTVRRFRALPNPQHVG